MSATTDMRDAYIAAELAILKGQSYRFGDRILTLANLQEIRAGRREWEQRASVEARLAASQGQANSGPLSTYGADFGEGTQFAVETSDGWSKLG